MTQITIATNPLLDRSIGYLDLRVLLIAYQWPRWVRDSRHACYFTRYAETEMIYRLSRPYGWWQLARIEEKGGVHQVCVRDVDERDDDFLDRVLKKFPEVLMAEAL